MHTSEEKVLVCGRCLCSCVRSVCVCLCVRVRVRVCVRVCVVEGVSFEITKFCFLFQKKTSQPLLEMG